jgi:hypothetical protein
MLESVLKRFPELTKDDVRLQDDGNGVYVAYWNSDKPRPTTEDLINWNTEDANLPKQLTPFEQLEKDQTDLIFTLMMNGVI